MTEDYWIGYLVTNGAPPQQNHLEQVDKQCPISINTNIRQLEILHYPRTTRYLLWPHSALCVSLLPLFSNDLSRCFPLFMYTPSVHKQGIRLCGRPGYLVCHYSSRTTVVPFLHKPFEAYLSATFPLLQVKNRSWRMLCRVSYVPRQKCLHSSICCVWRHHCSGPRYHCGTTNEGWRYINSESDP